MPRIFSTADQALARRLEAAEAANLTRLAQASQSSGHPTAFESFAGGIAVFAGIGSPMTHAVGIGLQGSVSEEEMERMEEFFRSRASACVIDFCPLADTSVVAFVQNHPYRVTELNNVLVREIEADERFEAASGVRKVSQSELPAWSRLIVQGFSEQMNVSEETVQTMLATLGESECWAASDGDFVSGAAMGIQNGVALFYGDATLPAARRRGWQSLLIRERLCSAQKQGCNLAAASVLPGSTSHRNYERAGFQLIYMRVVITRDFAQIQGPA